MSDSNAEESSNGQSIVVRRASLRAAFDRQDINRDGRVTLGEFIRLVSSLDASLTTELCETFFAGLDPELHGSVDFEAFYIWWSQRTGS